MGFRISFFGSSLVSAYWNGAATYYRGIIKALNEKGHRTTFYEPDAYERQKHRDMEDPFWAEVKVYNPSVDQVYRMLDDASGADIIVKASGVGVNDELLESAVLEHRKANQLVIFWDVDAPATLERIKKDPSDPFRNLIPLYEIILTYGGGDAVVQAYKAQGARQCIPVYNALDPATHFPVDPVNEYMCDLAFLGNRLPDREKRVDEFLLDTANALPAKKFILAGSGWQDKPLPPNVNYIGHLFTKDHNVFNSSPRALLNISRDSMASYGFSPATRVFEAAGAAACIITDYWKGIDYFFEPGKEILTAGDTYDVRDILKTLSKKEAKEIGRNAFRRVISEHTYRHRADQLESILEDKMNMKIKQV